MKQVLFLCFALTLPFTAFGGDSSDERALQGTWAPESAVLGGQAMPDAVIKMITLKMENGTYEVFVGKNPDHGTYTLDSTTQPKSITVTGTNGPNIGKTFPAIYELKDETLRICYDLSGAKRPAAFESVSGTKLYMVVYKRKKN